ncbi:hypothetical protein Enr17x_14680 [Gimesia fumaroli]|uniref:Uncharacterized protein n=1 Tax=Gimesia fumaroli TaxID=2527976 RepID=A0A518I8N0_9PLAN|nr:hypothetical protein Enr17x_14680 [Gimesia fumaroli]
MNSALVIYAAMFRKSNMGSPISKPGKFLFSLNIHIVYERVKYLADQVF